MPARRAALLPGLLLIAAGAWLMAGTLGVRLPDLLTLWPAALIVFGLTCLLQFFAAGRRGEGLVFTGVAAALLGVFLLAFTLGPLAWSQLFRWWPVFVVIAGLAFLAQWLTRLAERALLITALLALAVGLTALALTLGLVRSDLSEQVARWWPLLLILFGLAFLGNYALGLRRKE
jgi:hypothetical protein